jgi:hypothetical protein
LKTVRTAGYGDRDLSHPPARKINRPGRRRRLESVRHARACGYRALNLPPIACRRRKSDATARRFSSFGKSTGRASGTRSKRAGTARCGDQDLGFPPAQESVISNQISDSWFPHSDHRLLITDSWFREVPIRTGWCRRCAVNAVPSGKRFNSIHFPPIFCDESVSRAD